MAAIPGHKIFILGILKYEFTRRVIYINKFVKNVNNYKYILVNPVEMNKHFFS